MLEGSPGENTTHYFSKFLGNLAYKQNKTFIFYKIFGKIE